MVRCLSPVLQTGISKLHRVPIHVALFSYCFCLLSVTSGKEAWLGQTPQSDNQLSMLLFYSPMRPCTYSLFFPFSIPISLSSHRHSSTFHLYPFWWNLFYFLLFLFSIILISRILVWTLSLASTWFVVFCGMKIPRSPISTWPVILWNNLPVNVYAYELLHLRKIPLKLCVQECLCAHHRLCTLWNDHSTARSFYRNSTTNYIV